QRSAVAGPHRPQLLRTAVRQAAPCGRRVVGCQVAEPDLRLVEMAVPVPPPLPGCAPARADREGASGAIAGSA
ncbi:MAG: hypothetical protein DMF84_19755, partial [Acidobacteria bacterium]